MIIALIIISAVATLAIVVLYLISYWKLFTKAGKPGWACLVPVYNNYTLAEIGGKPGWMGIVAGLISINRYSANQQIHGTTAIIVTTAIFGVLGLVSLIFWVLISIGIAKNFGKSTGFGFLIAFLPFVGVPIIAFGKSKYKEEKTTESKLLIFSIILIAIILIGTLVTVVLLLAIPGLKRVSDNANRHSDVLAIASTIKLYETGTSPLLPYVAQGQNKQLSLCTDSTCQGGSTYDTLVYYKPQNVSIVAYSPNLKATDTSKVVIVDNATCNPSNTAVGSYQTHSVAILYEAENFSGTIPKCYKVASYTYTDPTAFPYCGVVPETNMSQATYQYLEAVIVENEAKLPISNDIQKNNDVASLDDISFTLEADKQFLNGITKIGYPQNAQADAKNLETAIQNYDNLLLTETADYNNVSASLSSQLDNASATRSAAAGTLRQDLNLPESSCTFRTP